MGLHRGFSSVASRPRSEVKASGRGSHLLRVFSLATILALILQILPFYLPLPSLDSFSEPPQKFAPLTRPLVAPGFISSRHSPPPVARSSSWPLVIDALFMPSSLDSSLPRLTSEAVLSILKPPSLAYAAPVAGGYITITKDYPAVVYQTWTVDDHILYDYQMDGYTGTKVLIWYSMTVINQSGTALDSTNFKITNTLPDVDGAPPAEWDWLFPSPNVWMAGSSPSYLIWRLQDGETIANDASSYVGKYQVRILHAPVKDRTVITDTYSLFYFNGQTYTETHNYTTLIRAPAYGVLITPTAGLSVCAGSLITYNVIVSNAGGAHMYANPFSVTVQLPTNVVTYSTDGGISGGSWVSWTFPPLSTTQLYSRTLVVSPTGTWRNGDTIVLTATALSSPEVTPTVSASSTVTLRKVSAYFTGPPSGCANSTITFTNVSTEVTPTGWLWNFGDGATGTAGPTATHIFTAGGRYTVTLTVTGPCNSIVQTDTYSRPIDIGEAVASFNYTPTTPCVGSMVYFTDTSQITDTAAGYLWNFGDGSTATVSNTTHTYTQSGLFTVTLTVTTSGGCSDVATGTVSVEDVVASFVHRPATACVGSLVYFTNTSQITGAVASYLWNFGDGFTATTRNATHAYTQTGLFTVTLTVTTSGGCSDSTVRIVRVEGLAASFNYSPPTICVGSMVYFTDTSQITDTATSYLWNFGDGSTATVSNTTHTYTRSGLFMVTLTVTTSAGCSDTATGTVSVEEVSASFVHAPEPLCFGGTVQFTSTSVVTGAVLSHTWNFGDGTITDTGTLNTVSHLYGQAGVYTAILTLTTSAGCYDTYSDTVHVEEVAASFIPTLTTVCVGSPVYFTSTSLITDGAASHSWNFGDGTIENTGIITTASHVYTQPGTFTVTLTVATSGGCYDVATGTVRVGGVNASFINAPDPICLGGIMFFADTSVVSGTVVSRLWDFGDGSTATTPNPSHTYARSGFLTVTLTITTNFGCSDSYSKTVRVEDITAQFDYAPITACVGSAVQFTDTSIVTGTVLNHTWDFGDGTVLNTGSGLYASHAYTQAGTFIVTMIATTTAGCTDTVSRTVTVLDKPTPSFETNSPICLWDTMFFTYTGSPVSQFWWNFGDGGTSTSQNPTHIYSAANTYTVTLVVTSAGECSATTNSTVIVNPLPNPILQPISATIRVSETLVFTDSGSGGNWREWNFGDGVVITTSDITATHHYSVVGTYTIILTSTNLATGCYSSTQGTVTVIPAITRLYLPIIFKNYQSLPDLIVLNVNVDPANPRVGQPVTITVTINNQGEAEANDFWVDLYIDPIRAPQVNEIWPELCPGGPTDPNCYGIAWLIPSLPAGGTTTVNSNGGFGPRYSHWNGFFVTAGTHTLYAQVDSYGEPQPYGAVLETHEATGGPYNNVLGPQVVNVSP